MPCPHSMHAVFCMCLPKSHMSNSILGHIWRIGDIRWKRRRREGRAGRRVQAGRHSKVGIQGILGSCHRLKARRLQEANKLHQPKESNRFHASSEKSNKSGIHWGMLAMSCPKQRREREGSEKKFCIGLICLPCRQNKSANE